jgi:hypothetical protein
MLAKEKEKRRKGRGGAEQRAVRFVSTHGTTPFIPNTDKKKKKRRRREYA